MTTTMYTAESRNTAFIITAIEVDGPVSSIGATYARDIDGRYVATYHRDGAWHLARQQSLPVRFVRAGEATRDLGVVFHPGLFEHRVYSGYVGYGLSMTDGYYAPISFEAWVTAFRANPDGWDRAGNDSQHTTADMDAYKAALATLSA